MATGEFDQLAFADRDVIERTSGRFPFASSFHWVNATKSGHLVNYHYSAYESYEKVFKQL